MVTFPSGLTQEGINEKLVLTEKFIIRKKKYEQLQQLEETRKLAAQEGMV